MFQEFYAQNATTLMPLVGMGICVVTLLAILVWVVFGLRNSTMLDYMANLPLSDGGVSGGRKEGLGDE